MSDDHYSIFTSILHLIYFQHMFQLALPFYDTPDLCLLVPETSKKVSCIRISKILVHNPNEDYIFFPQFVHSMSRQICVYHSMDSIRKKACQLFLIQNSFIDRIFGVCTPLVILVFFAFSHKDNNSTSSLPSCSTHSLCKADGTFGNIITNDKINFSNV